MFSAGKPEAGHGAPGGVTQVPAGDTPVCTAQEAVGWLCCQGRAGSCSACHLPSPVALTLQRRYSRILLWYQPGPSDGACLVLLYVTHWLKWSRTWLLSAVSTALRSQTASRLGHLGGLRAKLTSENEVKNELSTSVFSMSHVTISSTPLTSGTILSLPQKLFLLLFNPLLVPSPAELLNF